MGNCIRKGTLAGWHGGRQVAIEVSEPVMDRFHDIKRRLKTTESRLMSSIASQVPFNHKLDESHVIWYLDQLESRQTGQAEGV
jgi:hypothetical protein